jgi:hypothetical protein
MQEFILITSQIVFSFSRTLNVRYTAKDMVLMSVITSTAIKFTWLISATIGVNSVIEQDWLTTGLYVVSGLVGDWLSFKIKI